MKKINVVNVNQLQSKASYIIKEANKGQIFEIVRYSKPQAVIISSEEYECLTGKCHDCVKSFIKKFKNNSILKNNL